MLQNKGRVNRVSINSVRNFTATDSRYATGMNIVHAWGITLFLCQPVAVPIRGVESRSLVTVNNDRATRNRNTDARSICGCREVAGNRALRG